MGEEEAGIDYAKPQRAKAVGEECWSLWLPGESRWGMGQWRLREVSALLPSSSTLPCHTQSSVSTAYLGCLANIIDQVGEEMYLVLNASLFDNA